MQYTEEVLDHFRNPGNMSEIEDADGIGEIGNAKCGDIMKMYIKIKNEVIIDVKFKTFGCAAAVATSSMAIVLTKDKKLLKLYRLQTGLLPKCLEVCYL
jgi:nitrogen fixation NifU-like protein